MAELERLISTTASSGTLVRSRGSVLPDGEQWTLHLEIDSGAGTGVRDLRDASCSRLAQVAALSLALAVESGAAVPAPLRAAPRMQAPLEPPRWLIRAFLAGDLGSLEAPGPGSGLVVGLFLGRTRLELSAAYWLPQTSSGLRYELASAGLHACQPLIEEPEIGLCAGVEGGRMQVRLAATGTSLVHGWLGLTGGAALGWSFTSWLALRLEIGIGVTLLAPEVGTLAEGHGPSSLFGRAALGLEVLFR